MRELTLKNTHWLRTLFLWLSFLLLIPSVHAEWEDKEDFSAYWDANAGVIKVRITYFKTYGAIGDGHEGFRYKQSDEDHNTEKSKFTLVAKKKGTTTRQYVMKGWISDADTGDDFHFEYDSHMDYVVTHKTGSASKKSQKKVGIRGDVIEDEKMKWVDIEIPWDKEGTVDLELTGIWWRRGSAKDETIKNHRYPEVSVDISSIKSVSGDYSNAKNLAYTINWSSDSNGDQDPMTYIRVLDKNGKELGTDQEGSHKSGQFVLELSDKSVGVMDEYRVVRVYKKSQMLKEREAKVVRAGYNLPTGNLDVELDKDKRKLTTKWKVMPPERGETYKEDDFKVELGGVDKETGAELPVTVFYVPFSKNLTSYSYDIDLPEEVLAEYEVKVGRADVWDFDQWKKYKLSAKQTFDVQHYFLSAPHAKLNEDRRSATLTWQVNGNYWSKGTELLITRYLGSGSSRVQDGLPIKVTSNSAFVDSKYVDENMSTCNIYTYGFQVVPGGQYATKSIAYAPEEVTPVDIGELSDFKSSKGYFSDRIKLNWKAVGPFDKFVVKRRLYKEGGSNAEEFKPLGADIPAVAGMTNYEYEDRNCEPGQIYEYAIFGFVNCTSIGKELYVKNDEEIIGFRMPTGTVSGRVSFKSGQGVYGVDMRLSSDDPISKGYSLKLGGSIKDSLKTDGFVRQTNADYTFQAYVKPALEGENGLVMKKGDYVLGLKAGVPYFSVGTDMVKAEEPLPKGTYSQLSAVYNKDNKELTLVVYTDEKNVYSKNIALDPLLADDYLIMGVQLNGWLDEVRVWDRVLTPTEIDNSYHRILNGNEDGLVAYYRFNEPVKGAFFDMSYKGGVYNERHGKTIGTVAYDNVNVPTEDELSLSCMTDSLGDYRIVGVPYAGEGTVYSLVPYLGTHKFIHEGSQEICYLTVGGSDVVSFSENFTDISAFNVSGVVYYANTKVPVKGVTFLVDGVFATDEHRKQVTTGEDGLFTVSVPVGRHEVQAYKDGHVFVNEGRLTNDKGGDRNYQDDQVNVHFWDSTTVRVLGRVVGGEVQSRQPIGHSLSKNNLGNEIKLTFELEKPTGDLVISDTTVVMKHHNDTITNNVEYKRKHIFVAANAQTGEYVVDLIPEKFVVSSLSVTGRGNILGDTEESLDLRNSLSKLRSLYPKNPKEGEKQDTVFYNAEYSKTVTDPIVFDFAEVLLQDVFKDSVLIDSLPAFEFKPCFGNDSDYIALSSVEEGTVEEVVPLFNPEDSTYNFGYPVYKENLPYTYLISAYTPYYFNNDRNSARVDVVPLVGGEVSIANELKKENVTKLLNKEGKTLYQFIPDNPDIDVANDGLRQFQITLEANGKTSDTRTLQAYVLGGVSMGNDFVTAGPNNLITVLRDPPGSRSFAYLNEGSKFSEVHSKQRFDVTYAGDVSGGFTLGHKLIQYIGWSVGTVFTLEDFANTTTLKLKWDVGGQKNRTNTAEYTFMNTVKTSGEPAFVGRNADLFVGNSTNVVLGKRKNLGIKTVEAFSGSVDVEASKSKDGKYIICSNEALSASQEFSTLFAYPQVHIERVVIPKCKSLIVDVLERGRDLSPAQAQQKANKNNYMVYVPKLKSDDPNYGKANHTDCELILEDYPHLSTDYYDFYLPKEKLDSLLSDNGDDLFMATDTLQILENSVNNWIALLARNEEEKLAAFNTPAKNVSIQGGANVEHSHDFASSSTNQRTVHWGVEGHLNVQGHFLALIAQFSWQTNQGLLYKGNIVDSHTEAKSCHQGFVLSEIGGDYMSVDVHGMQDTLATSASNYVYRLRGGATKGPHEGVERTKYALEKDSVTVKDEILSYGSLQIENPKISADVVSLNNIPSNKPATFTLKMYNESESHQSCWCYLRMVDESITESARIFVDGAPLGEGRPFLLEAGNVLTKKLEIFRGEDTFDLENMKFYVAPQDQCDPMSYYGVIADTVNLSAHFIPASTEVHIKSPADHWTLNLDCEQDSTDAYFIPVTVDGYDINDPRFEHIEVQYKAANESKWTVLRRFFKNPELIKDPVIDASIDDRVELTTNFFGAHDQLYDLRAVSFSKYGEEWITSESEIVSGVKDLKRPRLFGQPKPADGILGAEDEVMLQFNENINEGLLAVANFEVSAVKNGAKNDHSVSVHLDGESNGILSSFEKDWSNKNLTIEFWMQLDDVEKECVLFNHGNANGQLTIGKAAATKVAGTTYTDKGMLTVHFTGMQETLTSGAVKLDEGIWNHVALVLDNESHEMTLYFNYQRVGKMVDIPLYRGIGKMSMGQGLLGNLDEVRVWDKVVSMTDIQARSTTRLSGAEPSLMVYYPMDEAKGEWVMDKARGNHAALRGSWNTEAGYALHLPGNSALKIANLVPVVEEQNYTLEFWFKTAVDNEPNSTLLSTGKGDGTDQEDTKDNLFIGFENNELMVRSDGQVLLVPGNYNDQLWHHFVMTVNREGGYAQVYVDEEKKAYIDSEKICAFNRPNVSVGARRYYQQAEHKDVATDLFFKGWIDEYRLWNNSFTEADIRNHANMKMKGKEMGLVAYYPLEEWVTNINNIKELKFTLEEQVRKQTAAELQGKADSTLNDHAPLVSKGEETPVGFDFVVNKDALLIQLTEPEERIDNTIVNFAVSHVTDMNGNENEGVIRWSALINRNPLRWADEQKVVEMKQYDESQFTVALNNLSGNARNFSLEGLPVWLEASAVSGEVQPNSSLDIVFTVDRGLNVGRYDERIYARGDNGVAAALPLLVKVNGDRPDWKVNPNAYQNNIAIFSQMKFMNVLSDDAEDMIGVFLKDGTCVGVGNSQYDKNADMWYTYLTIHTADLPLDGANLDSLYDFRMWDASTGIIYSAYPSVPLVFNKSICGSLKNLVVFSGDELKYRDVDLSRGWNWATFAVTEDQHNSVNEVLRYGNWMLGDVIKTGQEFCDYSKNTGQWVGTLDNITSDKMYIVHVRRAQNVSISGREHLTEPLHVAAGKWNYIGYLPSFNMSVRDAMVGFPAQEGDILKSQHQFTMFSDGIWVGSLKNMEVNKGYMLYTGSDADFVYPAENVLQRNSRSGAAVAENRPNLELNYPTNLTMVAVPVYDELQSGDLIAAYVNGELRGLSEIVRTDDERQPLHFINVAGMDDAEMVTFALLRNGEKKSVASVPMTYQANAAYGTVKEPMQISFNSGDQSVTVYPNPFVNYLNIEFFAEEEGKADISIYDLAGRLIMQKSLDAHAGRNKYTWNAVSNQGVTCAGGVHMVRVTVDGKTVVHEVIKK